MNWHIPKPLLRFATGIAALAAVALLLGGCSVYRINIQQGNYLDDKSIGQVETGMTRSQVRFVLGTPMVADSFHDNRWDYVFYFRNGRSGETLRRHIVVYFDGDSVSRIEDASAAS